MDYSLLTVISTLEVVIDVIEVSWVRIDSSDPTSRTKGSTHPLLSILEGHFINSEVLLNPEKKVDTVVRIDTPPP